MATAISVDLARPAAPAVAPAWRGRLVEFMLVGGLTLALYPLSWIVRAAFRPDEAELAVGFSAFYLAFVVNDPHFSVTYVLFYRDVRRRALGGDVAFAQRARYVFAGFVAPLLLVLWAALSVARGSAEAIGGMVQLMYFLVGWHYVKQGFGVFSVLSARHGARVTPRERVVVLAHCFAGWAFAWANPAAAPASYEEKGIVYTSIVHPRWLEVAAGGAFIVSGIALAVVLAQRWHRERKLLPLAPLLGLLVTIWSWTIFSSVDPLLRYVIPGLHSVQYLYFVWLMKRNEARAEEGPPRFGRPTAVRLGVLALSALALGWLLFHGLPEFLDTAFVPHGRTHVTGPLGDTPFFAVIFVFVNIHHYLMDHVIWRRENPDTQWLKAP